VIDRLLLRQGHFPRYFRAFPSQSVPSAKMQFNVLKLKVCKT